MRALLSLPILFILCGCVSTTYESPSSALTVMTYNVENLFDSLDDPGKNDETYLPLSAKKSALHRAKCQKAGRAWWIKQCLETDWNDSKIKRKMGRLADVILQVKNGKGPDILILEEVENLNILERLRLNHLQAAGYRKSILIEGPDERGIDVAMLSRLPLKGEPKLNEIKLTQMNKKTKKEVPGRPTRGILQAQFELPGGQSLTVLGVHFPSQGGPTALRKTAIQKLLEVKTTLPKDEYVIAAGDFNITAEEDAQHGLFSERLAKDFLISHQIGCDDCEGTHNYRGRWSFLDAILFSKNFQGEKWQVDAKSIRVANKSIFQLNHYGRPARFDEGLSQKGVSDHFPLAADIIPVEVR